MTDHVPEMVPNAHDRLINHSVQQWSPGPPAAERAIEAAYCDGAKAERARIIAALREPSDGCLKGLVQHEFSGGLTDPVQGRRWHLRRDLRALADWLERQPT